MSDLISRKALIETIEKNCYPIRYNRCSEENGITVTGIMQAINEQTTAFDLEGVIKQFEERIENYKNLNSDEQIVDVAIKEIQRDLEILKSAANATNGKNGG